MTIRFFFLVAVLGAALGGGFVWLLMARQLRTARRQAAEQSEAIRKLAHDVRGAVTPALLMTERLESNPDPAVRLAAGVVAKAMDRAADVAKAAAAQARAVAPPPQRDV
jgi:signal transduction histidine kinase